ncbi:transcription factor TFIIIC subunit tfc4 [Coemansia erecta]|nr:transcription factor TFIIIC subunit tfc4 [Coemansia erecta]
MNNGSDDDDDEPHFGGDGNEYDEAVLMNAMRSAVEMFAAEGLGNMVNIDSLQRMQQTAATNSSISGPQHHAEDDNYEDEQSSGYSSFASDDNQSAPLVARLEELSIPAAPTIPSARRHRATKKNIATYDEQATNDGRDSDFNTNEYIAEDDDDEDSNYENSDAYSSSDDEYHMQAIHNEMRGSAGFSKHSYQIVKRNAQGGLGMRRVRNPPGRPRGSGRRGRPPSYSHEVNQLLGTANRFYVENDLVQAFNTFCTAIQIDPGCVAAWNTMALIREEQGKYDDALQLCTVAAHLNSSDVSLWERLYSMHMDTAAQSEKAIAATGDEAAKKAYKEATDQALYCINQIIRTEPQNRDARERKIEILQKRNDQKAIIRAYKGMIHANSKDMKTIREVSIIFAKQLNDVETPIMWFTQAIAFYNDKAIDFAEEAAAKQANSRRRRQNKHKGADKDSDMMDIDDESSTGTESDDGSEEAADGNEHPEYIYTDPTQTLPMDKLGGYSYSDLNMLVELRLLRREYEAGIVDIKRGARFIQGRGRDTAWAEKELDDQMDTEYSVDSTEGDANELPIELRIKLGQCRLMLGHEKSAEKHINQLFMMDPVVYEDLYTDVADAYAELDNADLAIKIYSMLMNCPETNQPSIWERLAKCHRDAGALDRARKFGEMVIDADPSDLDMRLWLAELYEEMGEVQLAYEMISSAEDIQLAETTTDHSAAVATRGLYRHRLYTPATTNTKRAATSGAELPPDGVYETQNGQPSSNSLDPAVMQIKVRLPSEHTLQKRRTADDERKRCLAAMRSADVAFRKLDLLKSQIDQTGDCTATADYCATAQRLYDDWRHMSAFYMSNKRRQFRNYRQGVLSQLESSAQHGDIDMLSPLADGQAAVQRRLARMKARLSSKQQRQTAKNSMDGSTRSDNEDEEEGDDSGDTVATTFRAQTFDRWHSMFLMYGKCLVLENEHSEALGMLDIVCQSNVFRNDVGKRRTLKLLMTGIALAGGLDSHLYSLMRWWSGAKPAKSPAYKLFGYAMATSASAASSLTTSTVYKFARRLLQHLDEMFSFASSSCSDAAPRMAENMYPMRSDQPLLVRNGGAKAKADDVGLQIIGTATTAFRTDGISADRERYSLTRSDAAALRAFAGHVMLVARAGKPTITQYTMALAMQPENAPVALHLGVAYLVHAARSDTRENRQRNAVRGLVYIQRYAELKHMQEMDDASSSAAAGVQPARRGERRSDGSVDVVVVQEVAYNYARAFHFLGLVDLAATYYKRVFELPVSLAASSGGDGARVTCDLRREAAYNLATIYTLSGSLLKAKAVLREHCTID